MTAGDWVDRFVAATDHLTSPELYRKWAAIAILAGAMERKVWVRTMGSNTYPNLYIILVGPPGVGKTEVTWRIRDFWKTLKKHHMAHSSVTKAALMDDLAEATRHITRIGEDPAVVTFNSLLVCSNELGVLLPAYDTEFMSALTDLWDCKSYSEKRRTRDKTIEIENVQLNLVAGCTPAYLTGTLPEGAWDQGLTSRIIFIYCGEQQLRDLFEETEDDIEAEKVLHSDLKLISEAYGAMQFTPEAAAYLTNWYKNGQAPQPDHPKLHHYLSRRTRHLIKLTMVASISQSTSLIIEKEHVLRALDWLIEAELYMPEIFKSMENTSHAKLIEETWHFVYKIYMKEGKRAVAATRVISYVSQRMPAHNVERFIAIMESSGILRRQMEKNGNAYIPVIRAE